MAHKGTPAVCADRRVLPVSSKSPQNKKLDGLGFGPMSPLHDLSVPTLPASVSLCVALTTEGENTRHAEAPPSSLLFTVVTQDGEPPMENLNCPGSRTCPLSQGPAPGHPRRLTAFRMVPWRGRPEQSHLSWSASPSLLPDVPVQFPSVPRDLGASEAAPQHLFPARPPPPNTRASHRTPLRTWQLRANSQHFGLKGNQEKEPQPSGQSWAGPAGRWEAGAWGCRDSGSGSWRPGCASEPEPGGFLRTSQQGAPPWCSHRPEATGSPVVTKCTCRRYQ